MPPVQSHKMPSHQNGKKSNFVGVKIVSQHYISCMSKETIDSKTLAVRVPTQVFEKFKERCDQEGFRMSEVLRLYMREFSTHGPRGALAAVRDVILGMCEVKHQEPTAEINKKIVRCMERYLNGGLPFDGEDKPTGDK